MKNNKFKTLFTNFTDSNFSWDNYPRPTLKRDSFLPLNNNWDLSVIKKNSTTYIGKIQLPYPPESVLSNVNRQLKKGEKYLYKTSFILPNNFFKDKLILNFGAVDQIANVYINNTKVYTHVGGYLPFSIDITNQTLLNEENILQVEVIDNLDKTFGYGKQKKNRGGMWYTPISGIWQTVWLESVSSNYISDIKITTKDNFVYIKTTGGATQKTLNVLSHPQLNVSYTGDTITLEVPNPILWDVENPYLYNFTISCGQDVVSSYFAIRKIEIKNIKEKQYICLNDKPIFLHALFRSRIFPRWYIYT